VIRPVSGYFSFLHVDPGKILFCYSARHSQSLAQSPNIMSLGKHRMVFLISKNEWYAKRTEGS
jgi:hypothetical protein